MMIDALDSFLPPGGAGQSLVGGAGVDVQIGDVLDFLGQGVGTAPANIIGNATLFGTDLGVGNNFALPQLEILIGTALATSNAATVTFKIQLAADLGTPTYQPDTWNTALQTGPIAVASLPAQGRVRMDWPPVPPPETLRPRYARLIMSPAAGTNLSAGTATWAGVTLGRDDQSNKQAASNFKVS